MLGECVAKEIEARHTQEPSAKWPKPTILNYFQKSLSNVELLYGE